MTETRDQRAVRLFAEREKGKVHCDNKDCKNDIYLTHVVFLWPKEGQKNGEAEVYYIHKEGSQWQRLCCKCGKQGHDIDATPPTVYC